MADHSDAPDHRADVAGLPVITVARWIGLMAIVAAIFLGDYRGAAPAVQVSKGGASLDVTYYTTPSVNWGDGTWVTPSR